MRKIKTFKIKGDHITLGQFLKEEDYISSGGQAKWFLSEQSVWLNGVEENRRGKKLYPGDKLKLQDQDYVFEQA